jgi:hypothetical protein
VGSRWLIGMAGLLVLLAGCARQVDRPTTVEAAWKAVRGARYYLEIRAALGEPDDWIGEGFGMGVWRYPDQGELWVLLRGTGADGAERQRWPHPWPERRPDLRGDARVTAIRARQDGRVLHASTVDDRW